MPKLIAAPSKEERVVARFNAGCVKIGDGIVLLLWRKNRKFPRPGQPVDITSSFEKVILVDGKARIEEEVLERNNLPKGHINLEDPRIFRLGKKLLIGVSSVDKNGIPHPALVEAEFPFGKADFSKPFVFENLPPGKNFTFVEETVALYRMDDDKYNNTLAYLEMKKTTDGVWQAKLRKDKLIRFPQDLPWANYRIGLTGNEKIYLPNGNFILLVHGVSKSYEYTLGRAEFTLDWDLVSVDRKPILTYSQMQELCPDDVHHQEFNADKRVIYSCGYYLDKKLVHVFVTNKERTIREVCFPKEKLCQPFKEPLGVRVPVVV
ncbi:MAG: hypothetical protein Q8Q24_01685 [bacterium]|nr:hypothetical protein [bacterium]